MKRAAPLSGPALVRPIDGHRAEVLQAKAVGRRPPPFSEWCRRRGLEAGPLTQQPNRR